VVRLVLSGYAPPFLLLRFTFKLESRYVYSGWQGVVIFSINIRVTRVVIEKCYGFCIRVSFLDPFYLAQLILT
jgi:hypothetical protein